MRVLNERGVKKICNFQPIRCWQSEKGHTLWWVCVSWAFLVITSVDSMQRWRWRTSELSTGVIVTYTFHDRCQYTRQQSTYTGHTHRRHSPLTYTERQTWDNTQSQYWSTNVHRGPRKVSLYFYPYLLQLLTDFQNSFTTLLCRQLAIMWFWPIPPHHNASLHYLVKYQWNMHT